MNKKYLEPFKRKQIEEIKASIFGVFLCCGMVFALLAPLYVAGPIVLGTERNTNGLVEYLCLGAGCEDLTSMN